MITNVSIRLNGLELIEKRLQQEIEDLNQDLEDLAAIERRQLIAMQGISAILESELQTIFQSTLKQCEALVGQIFHPDNEKWIDSAEKNEAR